MKSKKRDELMEYVKAARRGSREAEIELYGHPLPKHTIVRSRKTYTRKQKHKGRQLPSFDSIILYC